VPLLLFYRNPSISIVSLHRSVAFILENSMRILCIIALFLGVFYSIATAQIDLTRAANDDTKAGYETYIDEQAPSEDAFVAVQRLAYWPINEKRWNDAVDIFKKYEPKFPAMHDRFEKIIAILSAPEEHLVLQNLGIGVNTAKDEFSPVSSIDGKRLYFTRDNGSEEGQTGEDIMVSEYREGMWQTANFVGSTIDTKS